MNYVINTAVVDRRRNKIFASYVLIESEMRKSVIDDSIWLLYRTKRRLDVGRDVLLKLADSCYRNTMYLKPFQDYRA